MKFTGDYEELIEQLKNKVKPALYDDFSEKITAFIEGVNLSEEKFHGIGTQSIVNKMYVEIINNIKGAGGVYDLCKTTTSYCSEIYLNLIAKQYFDTDMNGLDLPSGHGPSGVQTIFFINPSLATSVNGWNLAEKVTAETAFVLDCPDAIERWKELINRAKAIVDSFAIVKQNIVSVLNSVEEWTSLDVFNTTIKNIEALLQNIIQIINDITDRQEELTQEGLNSSTTFISDLADFETALGKVPISERGDRGGNNIDRGGSGGSGGSSAPIPTEAPPVGGSEGGYSGGGSEGGGGYSGGYEPEETPQTPEPTPEITQEERFAYELSNMPGVTEAPAVGVITTLPVQPTWPVEDPTEIVKPIITTDPVDTTMPVESEPGLFNPGGGTTMPVTDPGFIPTGYTTMPVEAPIIDPGEWGGLEEGGWATTMPVKDKIEPITTMPVERPNLDPREWVGLEEGGWATTMPVNDKIEPITTMPVELNGPINGIIGEPTSINIGEPTSVVIGATDVAIGEPISIEDGGYKTGPALPPGGFEGFGEYKNGDALGIAISPEDGGYKAGPALPPGGFEGFGEYKNGDALGTAISPEDGGYKAGPALPPGGFEGFGEYHGSEINQPNPNLVEKLSNIEIKSLPNSDYVTTYPDGGQVVKTQATFGEVPIGSGNAISQVGTTTNGNGSAYEITSYANGETTVNSPGSYNRQ